MSFGTRLAVRAGMPIAMVRSMDAVISNPMGGVRSALSSVKAVSLLVSYLLCRFTDVIDQKKSDVRTEMLLW